MMFLSRFLFDFNSVGPIFKINETKNKISEEFILRYFDNWEIVDFQNNLGKNEIKNEGSIDNGMIY
jgi:hypothetical protein